MPKVLPLDSIPAADLYVIHSNSAGVISGHPTATDAVWAFNLQAGKLGSDAAIYARHENCWHVF
jgi:hypothetical protein